MTSTRKCHNRPFSSVENIFALRKRERKKKQIPLTLQQQHKKKKPNAQRIVEKFVCFMTAKDQTKVAA